MRRSSKLERTANAYYNLGLERAQLRDLSGAAEFLKRALRFDKYCTDARNLLGLIYYEIGETADALCQWIISKNFQPDDNRADYYLDEVQRKPEQLERDRQAIKKFNQALQVAQSQSNDFAIIQLQHLLSERPKYVKAQICLALLYLDKKDYVHAGRPLMQVLRIDRNNPTALVLMDEVKKKTGKADVEQNKLKNAFSHRKMEDDDVIMPENKKVFKPINAVFAGIAGLAIGILIFFVLLMPKRELQINLEANQRIADNSRKLSTLNSDYNATKKELDELKSEYAVASQKLNAFEQENQNFSTMYSKLTTISSYVDNGRYTDAAKDWLTIDRDIDILKQEPLLSQLKEVDDKIYNACYTNLLDLGTQSWNAGKKAQAEEYYNLCLMIDPEDPECMYLKARLLQSQDRIQEANEIFDKIVGEHAASKYAEKAVAARGY